MNVTITIQGRDTLDQPFTDLATANITLGDAVVGFTPTVPPGNEGRDLRVEVKAGVAMCQFAVGRWLDPATRPGPTPIFDGQGVKIGETPAPQPDRRDWSKGAGPAGCTSPFRPGESLLIAPLEVAL